MSIAFDDHVFHLWYENTQWNQIKPISFPCKERTKLWKICGITLYLDEAWDPFSFNFWGVGGL